MAATALGAAISDQSVSENIKAAKRYTESLIDRLDHNLTPSEVRVHVKDGVPLTPEGVRLLAQYQHQGCRA